MAHTTHRGAVLAAALLMALAGWPASATAGGRSGKSGGALSRTTGAISNATSSSSRPSSGSPSSGDSGDSGTYTYTDYGRPYCPTCGLGPAGPRYPERAGGGGPAPVRLALDLGMQSVENSDGALMGEMRISRNGLGLIAAGTRYFETVDTLDGPEEIHMNVWRLAFAARAMHNGSTELWLSAGVSGNSSSEFESLNGAVVGMRLEHGLTRSVKFAGSLRYYAFQEGIRAHEARVGVSASLLSFGYRVFDVHEPGAEPLRGPEFGLAVGF